MSVFPNPVTNGNIFVQFPDVAETSSIMVIEIYDAFGRLVYAKQDVYSAGEIVSLQAGDLASGVYILKATMNANTAISKIIIQK